MFLRFRGASIGSYNGRVRPSGMNQPLAQSDSARLASLSVWILSANGRGAMCLDKSGATMAVSKRWNHTQTTFFSLQRSAVAGQLWDLRFVVSFLPRSIRIAI